MVNNVTIRERVAELQAKAKADSESWAKERESISSKFMQELDKEGPVESSKPASTGASNSDEEAVLVDAGGPGAASKGGTVKKRKGKK